MTLDELNRRVTEAITRAATLRKGSFEASTALREVSTLEEAIAAATRADTLEGEAARLGAVAAAVDAGEPLRALQLSQRYLEDAITAELRAQLDALVAEAEAQLQHSASAEPKVEPVTVTLRAA